MRGQKSEGGEPQYDLPDLRGKQRAWGKQEAVGRRK